MTDNEIIKAKELIKKLEEAYNDYYNTSKGMPYDLDKTLLKTAICLENLIDGINRQKAENEKLKTEATVKAVGGIADLIDSQKAEIERLETDNKTLENVIKNTFFEKAGFDINLSRQRVCEKD